MTTLEQTALNMIKYTFNDSYTLAPRHYTISSIVELDSNDEMRRRIGALLRELYDLIHDAVFTIEKGSREISRLGAYKYELFPAALTRRKKASAARYEDLKFLAISRVTRAQYAKSYYGAKIVVLKESDQLFGTETTTVAWLKSLPKEHRAMVRDITTVIPQPL